MNPSYQSPKVRIRATGSENKGVGTFAVEPIRRGEVISVTGGRILTRDEAESSELPYHPFQVEGDLHIGPLVTSEGGYDGIFAVNHSCEPNAGLRGQLTLVALRDIAAGEEICFDYAMTDSAPRAGEQTYEMRCLCAAPGCRGLITDRDWQRPELQRRYRGYFSTYLEARISQSSL